MDGNQTREGDTVRAGWAGTETVKKVKPDGTRLIKTKEGTYREDKNPTKARDDSDGSD